MSMIIKQAARKAKNKSYFLAGASIEKRDQVLAEIAKGLLHNIDAILAANQIDLNQAKSDHLNQVLLKRLALNSDKIKSMSEGVLGVVKLSDPLGKTELHRELDKRLVLKRVTVPIGLVGVIFESRPDAFIQIAALCIKSGNGVILKGGKEAVNTNTVLYKVVSEALLQVDAQLEGCVVLAKTREDIAALLALDDVIDLMIPRGSNSLVKYIKANTRIPVLGHADGICHLYVDNEVDLEMALDLTEDSKCQYPAVCNAIETLLVNREIASLFLPKLQKRIKQVELRGDQWVCQLINCNVASESDWESEYNDFILSIKIVDGLEEAISHINQYGSHHTDLIVTTNETKAEFFMQMVDSSSVMWNSSTRFADGFRYGFGAEVGISTNKIHARGPVGLEGLTLYKYRLIGKGDCVRPYVDNKKSFTHKDLK